MVDYLPISRKKINFQQFSMLTLGHVVPYINITHICPLTKRTRFLAI